MLHSRPRRRNTSLAGAHGIRELVDTYETISFFSWVWRFADGDTNLDVLTNRAFHVVRRFFRRLIGALVLAFIALSALPATAQIAWITQQGSSDVSRINTATDTVVPGTTAVGLTPTVILATATRVYIANFNSDTVTVLNATTAALVTTIAVGTNPFGLAISPDGTRLFVANRASGTISIVDTATNGIVGTITGGTLPAGMAVSADGSTIYIANESDGTVTARTIATNALVQTYPGFSSPRQIVLSTDGATAYVTNAGADTVGVLTLAGGAITNVTVGPTPTGLTRSPDGSAVYVTNRITNSVSRILTATNAITTATVGTQPQGVSISPDGAKLYVVNQGSNSVSVLNATTLAPISTIAVGAQPASIGQFISAAPAPAAVPTLSEWALILLGLTLAGGAAIYIQRRQLAA